MRRVAVTLGAMMVLACGGATPSAPVAVEIASAAPVPSDSPLTDASATADASPRPRRELPSSGLRATTAPDPARAEALFTEGRQLIAAGKTAEGCAKMEESLSADRAIGTMLNAAVC